MTETTIQLEAMMSDVDYIHARLKAGPATTMSLLMGSIRERGKGMIVHSRVAELRARLRPTGQTITCRRSGRDRHGNAEYEYTLEPLPATR